MDYAGLLHITFAQLLDAADETSWTAAFFDTSRKLGFESCLFAVLPSPLASFADVWVRSNYPKVWREHYDRKGYAALDPTVAHCMVQHLPLIWSQDIFASPDQMALYKEARNYGLRAGVSLPAHGPLGQVGMLCLVRDTEPDQNFCQKVADQLPLLSVFRDVIAQTSRQFIGVSMADNISLTSREVECLNWAASGKTSKEIAQLIHCSEPTVNFHFANVRRKFDVSNRQAAIVKAMEMNLIRRIDG